MGDSVQFLLELDAKAPGLDKLLTQLGALEPKLKATGEHVKAAGGHMDHASHKAESLAHVIRHEFGSIGHSVEYAKTELKELGEVFGAILVVEGVEKMIDAVKELGEEIVKTAAKTESTNFSLGLNFGNEQGEKISKWAEDLAKYTPFTGQQIKEWGNELAHAGVQFKDLNKYFFAGLDVAARTTDKVSGMSSAMEAFKRIVGTGQVRGQTLLELGIPMANIAKLERFKGETVPQIRKNLAKTTLTPDELFRSITGGEKIGETGAKMQNLLDTKLKNVKTLPEQYFEKASESDAFEPFKAKVNELYTALDPASPRGQEILKSFDHLLTQIVDGIKSINFDDVATDVRDVLISLRSIAEVMKDIVVLSGKMASVMAPRTLSADEKVAVVKESAQLKAESEHSWLGRLRHPMDALARKVGGALGADTGAGAVKGAEAVIPAVKEAGADVGKALHEGAAGPDGLDAHSPSRKMIDLGKMAGLGFPIGLRETAGAIGRAAADVFGVSRPTQRAARADAGSSGSARVEFHGTNIHVAHGGRDEGTAAAQGFFETFQALFQEMWERKRNEEGG